MSAGLPRFIDRFRQPEYTGENRCTPCTIVNVTIAVVVSAGLMFVTPFLGVAFFVFSLAAIYLRGYLVPGTPALTKKYFPDWLLRKFDKHEMATPAPEVTGREPEAVLTEANVIAPCEDLDDLCLDTDQDELEFEEHDNAFLARIDGRRLGQWESHAALVADLAAARILRKRYDEWDELPVDNQSRILSGLRIFLETCPDCGGMVAIEQETVESCCRSMDVVAATCENCEARILEVEQN